MQVFLDTLFASKGVPSGGFTLAGYLREEYALLFKTENLDSCANPSLAMVSVGATDGLRELTPKYKRLIDYKTYGIKEAFGLSWTEFIDLPRDEVIFMLEVQREDAAKQNSARDKAARDIERTGTL